MSYIHQEPMASIVEWNSHHIILKLWKKIYPMLDLIFDTHDVHAQHKKTDKRKPRTRRLCKWYIPRYYLSKLGGSLTPPSVRAVLAEDNNSCRLFYVQMYLNL